MPIDNINSSISGKVPDSCTDLTSTWIRRDCPCPKEQFERLGKKPKRLRNAESLMTERPLLAVTGKRHCIFILWRTKRWVLQSQWPRVQEKPFLLQGFMFTLFMYLQKKVQHSQLPSLLLWRVFKTYTYRIYVFFFLYFQRQKIGSLPHLQKRKGNSLIWWATGISVNFSWVWSPWLNILTHWCYRCSKVTVL